MNQERSIELIHADLDGEISADEREELRVLLENNPSLVEIRTDMRRLGDVLGQVDPVDPPAELHARIVASLPPARAHVADPGRRLARPRAARSGFFAAWAPPAVFRYAAAAAFGAAIVAVGMTISAPGHQGRPDAGSLVGTMTSYRASGAADRRLILDAAPISGAVGASLRNGMVVVEFDLEASQPVEIIADYSQAGLTFSGFAQFEEASASVEAAQGRVRFTQQDAHRYAVFFSPAGTGSGAIDFRFLVDGAIVHEDVLEIPATGRE